ncbi:hypothetical protein JDV02_002904 [Purpureocillium takamizusanense]|uniref:Uncharacterized protein n=1 Tax=Purpureocillium takamizusanense TaxID=2060973 RepID=A0A9Q8V884_9HYPO|nr:uncharacterized protein JDV02_002904 [Purpureocillium takamizusanense]UNI16473.1 hypothetical protein JDV02_002904 [Purpureocillium takamizusanense]
MCTKRIQERTHLLDKQATRQTLRQLLQEAMLALPSRAPFLDRSRKVLGKIDRWLHYQAPSRLQDMVESIQHLARLDGLPGMLDSIPNRQMDPGSRSSLLNMIRKLARYRDAARYLCRTAKKFAIVRRMEMKIAALPRQAFGTTPSLSKTEEPPSTFAGMQVSKKQKKQLGQCLGLLGRSEKDAVKKIMERKRSVLSEAKVHAEIQLIHYFETPRSQPYPRVICSSKDACFLCNAFITMHKKFYTPRCHGKLYPGWRLPLFTPGGDLERRFVNTLSNIVQQSLTLTLQRRKKIMNPYPLESTVPTIVLSDSTIVSSEHVAVDDAEGGALQIRAESSLSPGRAPPKEQAAAHYSDEGPCQSTDAHRRDEAVPVHIEPAIRSTKPAVLPLGKQLAVTVPANNASPALYEAWPLELQIEYSAPAPDRGKTLLCHLERLKDDDAEAVRNTRNATILDGTLLWESVTLRPEDFHDFYISAGGTLLRVSLA